jgi:hypothetical protein
MRSWRSFPGADFSNIFSRVKFPFPPFLGDVPQTSPPKFSAEKIYEKSAPGERPPTYCAQNVAKAVFQKRYLYMNPYFIEVQNNVSLRKVFRIEI